MRIIPVMRLIELFESTKTYTREQVSKIIKKMIDMRDEDAWEVNNGSCHVFAIQLAKKLGPEAKVVNSTYHYKDKTFPGHSWVLYNGYHFDSETPEGAKEPKDMQYHKRLRAIADSPENIPEDEAVRQALGHDPIYYGEKK